MEPIKNIYYPQVTETTTVLELKQRVEQHLRIPVSHQKILCVGRTLVDEKTLDTYKPALRSGCKLTLVVKEPEPLKDVIYKLFKRFYADDQSESMAKDVMAHQNQRIRDMSLDDLERLATYFLERDRQHQQRISLATSAKA